MSNRHNEMLSTQQQMGVKQILALGFKPLRITAKQAPDFSPPDRHGHRAREASSENKRSIVEAAKLSPTTADLRKLVLGRSRLFFVLHGDKDPLAFVNLVEAQKNARLAADNQWLKITGKMVATAGQQINCEKRKFNMTKDTTWAKRLEEAIVETLAVGFVPSCWHSNYASGLPDDDPIIVEAKQGGKSAFFHFSIKRQPRPYSTLSEAKVASNIPYLMSQAIHPDYVKTLSAKVEEAKKAHVIVTAEVVPDKEVTIAEIQDESSLWSSYYNDMM
jgi:hypothetical protein